MSRQLAEILLRDNKISQVQFDQAVAEAGPNGSPVKALVASKKMSEAKLVEYLSRRFNLASINLAKFTLDQKVISMIPTDLVRELQMIPIQAKSDVIVVAVCDPTRLAMADKVSSVLCCNSVSKFSSGGISSSRSIIVLTKPNLRMLSAYKFHTSSMMMSS
ncbi:MAG: hypothetical protein EOP04_16040 [Proteobacteria bacterium]|nr:MAG: hypothetical protein EOP04_16040 [Pseudomonadota bacterium]